jgi:purine-nucleoside phosphorylase
MRLNREIIEYNSEKDMVPDGAAAFGRRVLAPISWPGNSFKPQPEKRVGDGNKKLTAHDYLVVTWTVEEARALADVLTPGMPSSQWTDYNHLWHNYSRRIRNDAPAAKAQRLGSFCSTKIGDVSILRFKSELHMSQDGPDLPVADLWRQLIEEVQPKLVITTGTAGAIGTHLELGDVVVAATTRFDCTKSFKNSDFAQESYSSSAVDLSQLQGFLDFANNFLITENAGQLPAARRTPKAFSSSSQLGQADVVVTTDFFGFDDSSDFYRLERLGSAVEMGDAVLGYVSAQIGKQAPPWLVIRNASDPQIGGSQSIKEKAKQAASIYMKYGYWTTVNSAIACWAAIAAHARMGVPSLTKEKVAA